MRLRFILALTLWVSFASAELGEAPFVWNPAWTSLAPMELGRSGGIRQPWLPMGSEQSIGSFYDTVLNYYPSGTVDPRFSYGGADDRYYSGFPFPALNPGWPISGVSPYYYGERRFQGGQGGESYPNDFLRHVGNGSAPRATGLTRASMARSERGAREDSPGPEKGTDTEGVDPIPLVLDSGPGMPATLVRRGEVVAAVLSSAGAVDSTDASNSSTRSSAVAAPLAIQTPPRLAAAPAPAAGVPEPPVRPDGQPALQLGRASAGSAPAVVRLASDAIMRPPPAFAPSSFPLTSSRWYDPERDAWIEGEAEETTAVDETPADATVQDASGTSAEKSMEAVAASEGCLDGCGPAQTYPLAMQPIIEVREILDHPEVYSDAARGARKVMAVYYQNCDALSTTLPEGHRMSGTEQPPDHVASHLLNPNIYIKDTRAAAATMPYLKESGAYDGRVCKDPRKALPVFHPGGKATIRYVRTPTGTQLEVNPDNRNSNLSRGNLQTIDCIGFLSASMAASGLKFRRSANAWNAYQVSTLEAMNLPEQADSCMETPTFTPHQSVQSGDLIIFRQVNSEVYPGHSMMFEKVGRDPFGLSRITHLSQCGTYGKDSQIRVEDFDFSIIQSSSAAGRMAVTKTTAKELLTIKPEHLSLILEMAVEACIAKFKGEGPALAESSIGPPGKERSHKFARILRHVGRDVPGCSEPKPPRVIGEECVRGCEELKK